MVNLIIRSGKFLEKHYILFSTAVILQTFFYAAAGSFVTVSGTDNGFLFMATSLITLSTFSIGSVYKKIIECQFNDRLNWEMLFFNIKFDISSSFTVRLAAVFILEVLVLGLYAMGIDVGAYLFSASGTGLNFILTWAGYSLMLELSLTLLSTRLVANYSYENRGNITKHAVAAIMIAVGVVTTTVHSGAGIFALAMLMFYVYIFAIAMMRLNNESGDVY